MNKLRLLIFQECHKNCEGCCNKDWDLNSLPVNKNYYNYDEILITGGEPLLKPKLLKEIIGNIRKQNPITKIFVYTTFPQTKHLIDVLYISDGITITIHEQNDVKHFIRFRNNVYDFFIKNRSIRINIFKNIDIDDKYLRGMIVKKNIEYIKNCPLPTDEVFKRL